MNNLLTYDEYVDFILNKLKRSIDEPFDLEKRDEQTYIIKYGNGHITEAHMENSFEAYVKTGEIKNADIFVQTLLDMRNHSKNIVIENLIPVIRSQDTITAHKKQIQNAIITHGFKTDQEMTVIHDSIERGLELMYAFDTPTSLQFAVDTQLPNGVGLEEAKRIAKDNLIKRGWLTYSEKDSMSFGNLFYFKNSNKPFNAQFLYPEMYLEPMGDKFYVGFPGKDAVVVFKPHTYISGSKSLMKNALVEFGNYMKMFNMRETMPFSRSVYYVEDGKYKFIL